MAAQSVAGSPKVSRPMTLRIGIVVLVLGLLGVAAWGVVAWFSWDYGSVAGESLAGQMVVGQEDPVNEPGVLTGRIKENDRDPGVIVWTGTQQEYDEIWAEGRAMDQANVRETWLYPSAAVVGFGLILVTVGVVQSRRPGDEPEE